MSGSISATAMGIGRPVNRPSRSDAVLILQVFALTVMVIPADTVIAAIGAQGYVAGLVGILACAAFVAATLLGLHRPSQHRHPIRGVLCFVWLVTLVSYVLVDRRRDKRRASLVRGPDADTARGDLRSGARRRGVPHVAARRAAGTARFGLGRGGLRRCGRASVLDQPRSRRVPPDAARVLAQLREPGDRRAWKSQPGAGHVDNRDRARRGCRDAPAAGDPPCPLRHRAAKLPSVGRRWV